jgi:hypothetical protein
MLLVVSLVVRALRDWGGWRRLKKLIPAFGGRAVCVEEVTLQAMTMECQAWSTTWNRPAVLHVAQEGPSRCAQLDADLVRSSLSRLHQQFSAGAISRSSHQLPVKVRRLAFDAGSFQLAGLSLRRRVYNSEVLLLDKAAFKQAREVGSGVRSGQEQET